MPTMCFFVVEGIFILKGDIMTRMGNLPDFEGMRLVLTACKKMTVECSKTGQSLVVYTDGEGNISARKGKQKL